MKTRKREEKEDSKKLEREGVVESEES